jgi:hypothetical protein
MSSYSSGFKPSAAISSGEKGVEEMLDMNTLQWAGQCFILSIIWAEEF